MTTTQENLATETRDAPIYGAWCPDCYWNAIERLLKGFKIIHHERSFPDRKIKGLDEENPGMAVSMRHARDRIITEREHYPSDVARHAHHPGAH